MNKQQHEQLSKMLTAFFDAFNIKHNDPKMSIYKKILSQYNLEPIHKQMKHLIETWAPKYGKPMPSLAEILARAMDEKYALPLLPKESTRALPSDHQVKQYCKVKNILLSNKGKNFDSSWVINQIENPTFNTIEAVKAFMKGKNKIKENKC